MAFYWTDEEVERLIELSKDYNAKEIAHIMNIDIERVERKALKLGISLNKYHRIWTKEEEEYLKEYYGVYKIERISKYLNRTPASIKARCQKLNLDGMIKADKSILRICDICDILNVSRSTVFRWGHAGLNLKKRYVNNNSYFNYVTWNDLLSFLKNNLDKWDSTKVDYYMLKEEDWLKEKRLSDLNSKKTPKKDWTVDEIKLLIELYEANYTYPKIAATLNRSESSVGHVINRLHSNNINVGVKKLTKRKKDI